MNRALQVSMVKKTKSEEEITQDEHDEKLATAVLVSDVVKVSIRRIGVLVCTYVVLDTMRQVVVKSMTP